MEDGGCHNIPYKEFKEKGDQDAGATGEGYRTTTKHVGVISLFE